MKRKKILIAILATVLALSMLFAVACRPIVDNNNKTPSGSQTSGASNATNGDATKLQILKSSAKLTQEQVASKIKAEYLLQNNGYKDDDEVVVVIALDGESLIERYNKKYNKSYASVADYAASAEGIAYASTLSAKQDSMIAKLRSKGIILDVKYCYTTVMNAIAVTIKYGKLSNVENTSGIKYAMLSETFNRPQAASDVSSIVNPVDKYETGIFDSGDVDYTGQGTAVAILDSGFDLSHEVFSRQPATDKADLLLTDEKVSQYIVNNADSNARKITPDLDISKVYYSTKIPYSYDYADKDTDVFPYNSEHGTHVAGIIGGRSDVITGVAIDTQLVLMKVFPDLDDGGKTEDILAALEDAVRLKVDAINMSLGSACGFTREYDNNKLNSVYSSINEAGISLLTAASNSYSSSYGGEQGNTNFVTNPDSGTVGSPSTYGAALSVASINGENSRYIVADGEQIIFYNESNDITGESNHFFEDLYSYLGKATSEHLTLEYVVVPGAGLNINYASIDVTGKIVVVRRGSNSFEEKALIAKRHGAVACIIYNNIEGDILMSMGKTKSIPTISISKDVGTILEKKKSGTMVIKDGNQAGPFMSDFSSWGPTPSLELKPEITAHGGNIYSSVPNGGYDKLSGTSMATPNLCGVVILIRQYLKEQYPDKSWKEISVLANQMLMSTATIVLNEDGNPYSPRKQGAGLASLRNVVNTKAYLEVSGKDRPKLELGDDPTKTGVYTMLFNVVNTSNDSLQYDLSLVGMTESVSTSDSKHVAERPRLLNGNAEFRAISGGTLTGDTLTVGAAGKAEIEVAYKLTDSDKNTLDSLFPYGMYVEGFVKLQQIGEEKSVDLNIPFLAFYGDWTQAPMFDKTFYEVENEKYDTSIEDDDKLLADYYATTPYGSFFYNYIIPFGSYLYHMDTTKYEEIPASLDHIAISNVLGSIDGISAVYAGLLRCAKEMNFSITDKVTGEVIWTHTDYNATKAHSLGGSPIPYFDYLRLSSFSLGLMNNRQYEFKMQGLLDYGDGGLTTNVRNEFSFDFYMDNEAPILKQVVYEKEYDDNLEKDRYYLTMTIYDNHYVQSVSPVRFTSSSSYAYLTENPIPVYSTKGADNEIRIEITDYLQDMYADVMFTNSLAFSIDDYALNSNIYVCQLPGTWGDFKFTKDGEMEGTDLVILSMYENEIVDITRYLATADKTIDLDRDYLKYVEWTSSNTSVAQVNNGQVKCLQEGRATITARSTLPSILVVDGNQILEQKQAILIINVKPRLDDYAQGDNVLGNGDEVTMNDLRFAYFDTVFAYSRAAQTSEIGSTGDRSFISAKNVISMYPGEKIKLMPYIEPWYSADNYEYTYSSAINDIAIVGQDGVVTALKEGTTTIMYSVKGSPLTTSVVIQVKSEFVIENRILVAYKGLGGEVVIPDDEGIMQIGAYAFCLYRTDNTIEVSDEDYDANKIPATNTTITKVVVPRGVEEIQKYAFYNCTGLKEIVLPETLKIIREYAFYNDKKLETIDLSDTKVETIGRAAFYNCAKLQTIDLQRIYAIGVSAFENSGITETDLTSLRNTGDRAFFGTRSLTSVVLTQHTKLAREMFEGSGLVNADIYNTQSDIPARCFANCLSLQAVTIYGQIEKINTGAFAGCKNLASVIFGENGGISVIGEQAFQGCANLVKFTLPDNEVTLHNYAFAQCSKLEEVEFLANTVLRGVDFDLTLSEIQANSNAMSANINGYLFDQTALSKFTVSADNTMYKTNADNTMLISADDTTIVLVAIATAKGDYTVNGSYVRIGAGAFAGSEITTLTIPSAITEIGDYAFVNCVKLETVNLPSSAIVIGHYAFNRDANLTEVNNMACATKIGRYAFALTGITQADIGDNAICGEGAFFRTKVVTVNVGANASFGLGAFQRCDALTAVNMPADGGVYFGQGCFANDVALSSIDMTKIDEVIPYECFYGCTGLTSVNLQNVKEIGNYAFADCSALASVELGQVEKIGDGVFGRYSQFGYAPVITEITLPDTLIQMGEGVFAYCLRLTVAYIPESLTKIPDFTFSHCDLLTNVVTVGNTADNTSLPYVTEIGNDAFEGCLSLKAIDLSNVTKIGAYAFTSCDSLTTVNLQNVTVIGFGAFASSGVRGDIVADNLAVLGDYAFQKYIDDFGNTTSSITSFTANNLRVIGVAAFQHNRAMTKFVFSRALSEINILAFHDCLGINSFYYLDGQAEQNDGEINGYAKLVDGVLYTKMLNGHYQLTSVPANLDVSTLQVAEGTVRIDTYAGNGRLPFDYDAGGGNKNIENIILPNSLKYIGNYAFVGYGMLTSVEFKSVTAPVLESSYNKETELNENDPGYGIIHNIFDMFNDEMCYYTFGQVGKSNPITMYLPANTKIQGYDSIVYETYFGKVENAERSGYVAMEQALVEFLDYVEQLNKITTITLNNETLINNALAAYNAVTQNPADYGIRAYDYQMMVNKVKQAKNEVVALKIANSTKEIKDVQALIDKLPTSFSVKSSQQLREVQQAINSLSYDDRFILDTTRYDALVAQYEAYCQALQIELAPVVTNVNPSK